MGTLAHRLLAQARATPEQVALVDGRRRLDYAGLAAASRAFAAHLHAIGLRPGDRVAAHLANGLEAVVACYGSWIAGCTFVPLDAQARSRELGPQLASCGARVVVHDAARPDARIALGEHGLDATTVVVSADLEAAPWARLGIDDAAAPPRVLAEPACAAAILYTSGTTGRPKGVTLTHRNFSANVHAIIDYLRLAATDSIVSVLPFHYSYGASVLHTHLHAGARLVIHRDVAFPQTVVEALARERATGFSGVPATFALLLERVAPGDHDLSSLRYVTQAGGAMSPALAQRVCDAFPRARLYVMYGQTEATARLTWLPPEVRAARPRSAGRPVHGVTLEIRDDAGRALPPDVPGEVWARGDNIMAGYWNDPALSRTVLVDGWLRTGDMGRLDRDGYLYLAGRRSDLIKSGGHRIHPEEVEQVIAALPGVREVAVAGVDDDMLGQALRAYVIRAEGAAIDADQVRRHCRARLAGYKVPARVEFVEILPKTASGKVRRAVLADRGREDVA